MASDSDEDVSQLNPQGTRNRTQPVGSFIIHEPKRKSSPNIIVSTFIKILSLPTKPLHFKERLYFR